MPMEWEPKWKDFGIRCFQTLLFLIDVILPGLCSYVLAAIEVFHAVECAHLFSRDVPGAGVSSGLGRLFFSVSFGHVLVDALLTQTYITMSVISFARLYRSGLFRARAKAVPATFFTFKAVAMVGGYVAVIPVALGLIDALGEHEPPFMLLGFGGVYLTSAVFNAVVLHQRVHRICAVPVLKDVSGICFGAMRRRLALVGLLVLFGGFFVPVAVLTAPYPLKDLAARTATNAVQWTVTVAMQVTQPLVYLVLWNNYHSF